MCYWKAQGRADDGHVLHYNYMDNISFFHFRLHNKLEYRSMVDDVVLVYTRQTNLLAFYCFNKHDDYEGHVMLC